MKPPNSVAFIWKKTVKKRKKSLLVLYCNWNFFSFCVRTVSSVLAPFLFDKYAWWRVVCKWVWESYEHKKWRLSSCLLFGKFDCKKKKKLDPWNVLQLIPTWSKPVLFSDFLAWCVRIFLCQHYRLNIFFCHELAGSACLEFYICSYFRYS